MSNIPYTDIHADSVRVIIDIEFNDGTFNRGIIAHSIEFAPNEHWCLKIYKTMADVFKNNPILYWGVKKVEVIGVRL